jgi:hypothetical protein
MRTTYWATYLPYSAWAAGLRMPAHAVTYFWSFLP